jgi:RNA-splicing ligase RtcB
MKKIVVKIGTNVLSRPDGLLDITAMSHLVDQIAALKRDGKEVIVHRKGATPAGEGVLGVIPGSMADPAYVVRGKGCAASRLWMRTPWPTLSCACRSCPSSSP